MNNVLTTQALTKEYGHFKALDGLTMSVPARAIYGLVGKNGAGKQLCSALSVAYKAQRRVNTVFWELAIKTKKSSKHGKEWALS